VERGDSDVIWTRKQLSSMEHFLQDIDEVGNFISSIFTKVCPAVANQVSSVDPAIRLWDTITLMFWNATTINKVHVDSRDMKWSMMMLFGEFSRGEIDFPYLNTTVRVKRGDLYFIHSPKVFYNICSSSFGRKCYVFTNHTSIVRRFCSLSK
jgi:hypothetical protein